MNRVVIDINEHGELIGVACDVETRVFVLNRHCTTEPVYEFTEGFGKNTGVHFVREMIGDNLAATIDSTGSWKKTNAIEVIK